MPLYICRWQNGNFSAVSARSREHAILLLGEIGNAEVCELFPVKNFMIHFRLKDEVDNIEGVTPLELKRFGGETLDVLYDRVYPVYGNAAVDAVEAWPDDEPVRPQKVEEVLKRLNDALSTEHTRQWGALPPNISDDPTTAHLHKVGHVTKTAEERTDKERRFRKLLEILPGGNKVH
jgi:hypothetical protein